MAKKIEKKIGLVKKFLGGGQAPFFFFKNKPTYFPPKKPSVGGGPIFPCVERRREKSFLKTPLLLRTPPSTLIILQIC